MKGKIISDWTSLTPEALQNPVTRGHFVGALNHFMAQRENDAQIVQALNHFALDGDFPANLKTLIEKVHMVPNYDETWRDIFDVRDFTGTNASGFEMMDIESGLTFKQVKPGEKVELYKMSGSKVTIGFDLYGGGIGWQRTWFDDCQYWQMEDTMMEFTNKAYLRRSEIFYSLIDAVSSAQNLAWQTPLPSGLPATDPNYVAVRDYRTINKACENILLALKDKGWGITDSTNFVILAPIQLKERLNRAMGVANSGISANFQGIQYNVTLKYTMMLTATDKYYVILPKFRNKIGLRMNLQMFGAFDEMAYVDRMVAYMRFGGAIGDEDQFQRCATS